MTSAPWTWWCSCSRPRAWRKGLQRVGRSGHLVGQTSKGRIYATFREDIVEAAAVVRGMLDGDVEPTHTPANPLDVLAQQIVALVAQDDWDVSRLLALVRRAYPYAQLTRRVRSRARHAHWRLCARRDGLTVLRARIAWDRINRLTAPCPAPACWR